MCLAKEYTHLNFPKIKEGYKIFAKPDSGKFEHFYFKNSPAPKRRWLTASLEPPISPNHSRQYIAGFHVYMNKEHAVSNSDDWIDAVCHRVLFRDIITHGLQDKYDSRSYTIVCKQIYIMEEVIE